MTRFKDKPKKPMEPNTVAYCIDVPDRWTLTKRTNDWMDKQTTTDMRRGYRVGSFIDRAEFLFMRTCSMKKVSTDRTVLLEHHSFEIIILISFFRDHAITTANSKNSEDLPVKPSRQHVSLFPNKIPYP